MDTNADHPYLGNCGTEPLSCPDLDIFSELGFDFGPLPDVPKPDREIQEPTIDAEEVFEIVATEKERGEKYKFDEEKKVLVTKRGCWVPIKVKKLGMIKVSMRYEDQQHYHSNAVKACDSAESCLSQEFSSTSSHAFKVGLGDEKLLPSSNDTHPTVKLWTTSVDEVVRVAFQCNNSCDTHKKFNKKRWLILEFISGGQKITWELHLRVCEGVKRDYADITTGPRKKKKIDHQDIPASPNVETVQTDDFNLNNQTVITINNLDLEQLQQPQSITTLFPQATNSVQQMSSYPGAALVKQEFSHVKKGPFAKKEETEPVQARNTYMVQFPGEEIEKTMLDLIRLVGGKITSF